jgi:citrate lyase subunit beta-like protein
MDQHACFTHILIVCVCLFVCLPSFCSRINPIGSQLEEMDLYAALHGTHLTPHGIVLPKVEHADHLRWLGSVLDWEAKKQSGSLATYTGASQAPPSQPMHMIALIESPESLIQLRDIVHSHPALRGLVFGADDYAASIGATRTDIGAEIDYARNTILVHAKAANLHCIDSVQIDFRNADLLKHECDAAFRLGYTGKQVIHPSQIDIVQSSFAPDHALIQYSFALLKAHEEHAALGTGAFTFKGKMIDMVCAFVEKETGSGKRGDRRGLIIVGVLRILYAYFRSSIGMCVLYSVFANVANVPIVCVCVCVCVFFFYI